MAEGTRTKAQPDVGTLNVEVSTKSDAKVALDIEDAPFLQEKKTPVPLDTGELAVPEPEAPEEDGKSDKKKKIILAGGGALLVILLSVAAWWFLLRTPPPPPVAVEPEIIRVPSPPKAAVATDFIVSFDPFWVEVPDGKGGVVFLVAKFAAVTRNEALAQEARNKTITLRDAVYYYLKNKPYTFLIDPANIATIKNDLNSVLSGYLAGGKIDDMLFESYLGKS